MRNGLPTPGILDGMAAYDGPGRDDGADPQPREPLPAPAKSPSRCRRASAMTPTSTYAAATPNLSSAATGGVEAVFPVLGGTHTNCAGGPTPWGTWITCEEIFNYGSVESNVTPGTGVPHGYSFEIPADANGPVTPQPIIDAGRFSHEAVAWLDGALYETEDRGDAGFYRFLPERRPEEAGDLATFGGTLQALVVRGRPNFDANGANPGETYPVEWVDHRRAQPAHDTSAREAQSKGAAIFDRTEGIWTAGGRVYFDCTTGGDAGLGQLWEFRPRQWGGDLKLIYESVGRRGPREPRQSRGRPADRRRLLAGGLRRRAVRPRRHSAWARSTTSPAPSSTAPSSAAAASAPTGGPSSSTSRATG